MIKAIIFDFYGVLGIRGLRQFKQHYLGGNEEKAHQARLLQRELDAGVTGYDSFISGMARIAGVDRKTVLRYTENYKPNSDLVAYIRDQLKPQFKIGIISNSGADWVQKIIGEDNMKLFDDIILSYQVGIIKPEPGIYEMSAKNLGVRPAECVFVDDILSYCQGAESVGMEAIHYRDFNQFKRDLDRLLEAGADN